MEGAPTMPRVSPTRHGARQGPEVIYVTPQVLPQQQHPAQLQQHPAPALQQQQQQLQPQQQQSQTLWVFPSPQQAQWPAACPPPSAVCSSCALPQSPWRPPSPSVALGSPPQGWAGAPPRGGGESPRSAQRGPCVSPADPGAGFPAGAGRPRYWPEGPASSAALWPLPAQQRQHLLVPQGAPRPRPAEAAPHPECASPPPAPRNCDWSAQQQQQQQQQWRPEPSPPQRYHPPHQYSQQYGHRGAPPPAPAPPRVLDFASDSEPAPRPPAPVGWDPPGPPHRAEQPRPYSTRGRGEQRAGAGAAARGSSLGWGTASGTAGAAAREDALRRAAESAATPSAGVDGEKAGALMLAYSFAAGPRVLGEMEELADRMAEWYREKPGDVVDELLDNLRAPQGSDPEATLAVLARGIAGREGVREALPGACPAELLVLRGYTQKPVDIDRDMGWADAPPPAAPGEGRAAREARAEYEDRYNSWYWDETREGVQQRNGSIFGPVCAALRAQGASQSAEATLRRWAKWLCTLAAAASEDCAQPRDSFWRGVGGGGVTGELVAAHRVLAGGDLIAWPAPSSVSESHGASAEYMRGTAANSTARPSPERPGTMMFRLSGVRTGVPLGAVSQYPEEREHLLGPLCLFKVREVADDPSNQFGQGLRIALHCLGPLGRPLRESPVLGGFLAEVRRDARRASQRLGALLGAPSPLPEPVSPTAPYRPRVEQGEALSRAAASARSRATAPDRSRPALLAAAGRAAPGGGGGDGAEAGYVYTAGPGAVGDAEDCAAELMELYRSKPGTVVEELLVNLRAPPGGDAAASLAVVAHTLAERPEVAQEHRHHGPLQLMLLRSSTLHGIDLDRDLGWPDVAPPPTRGESAHAAAVRSDYQRRFNDPGWEIEVDGVPQRNASIADAVRNARRAPAGSAPPSSEQRRWAKWASTLAALSSGSLPTERARGGSEGWCGRGVGGLPSGVIEAHRRLQSGDTLHWPCATLLSSAPEKAEAAAHGGGGATPAPTPQNPGSIVFHIRGVHSGALLRTIGQYPGEGDILLAPFNCFRVSDVREDPRNPFGQGLLVTMDCLGPMGRPLAESPELKAFYEGVRADAERVSGKLVPLLRYSGPEAPRRSRRSTTTSALSLERVDSVGLYTPKWHPKGTPERELTGLTPTHDADEEAGLRRKNSIVTQAGVLRAAARSADIVADVIDGDKAVKAAEAYAFSTGNQVQEEMDRFAERMIQWYTEKPGNLLDELQDNLRPPPGGDVADSMAVIGHRLAKRALQCGAYQGMRPAELLVLRSYTQKPVDIDRDLGWPGVPGPPSKTDTAEVKAARAAYEKTYNDWDWAEVKDGELQRNGSIFGPVCSAMRDQGRNEWSAKVLRRWVKWACTVAAVTSDDMDEQDRDLWRGIGGGGLTREVVAKHRGLRPGHLLAWPAKSSTSFNKVASEEYMLGTAVNSTGRPSAEKPGSIMFRICSVRTGLPLQSLSQYPAEEELLIGPFTLFRIHSIEEDPKNPFGEGLRITMDCLGPLGTPLRDNPQLAAFFAMVREDARKVSVQLAARVSPREAAGLLLPPPGEGSPWRGGRFEKGCFVYYCPEGHPARPARVVGADAEGRLSILVTHSSAGAPSGAAGRVLDHIPPRLLRLMPCPRSPPRAPEEPPRRGHRPSPRRTQPHGAGR